MKIIKTGEWKQRLTCRGCSSIIEYVASDLQWEEKMQEDESFDLEFFITCPVCSRRIAQNNVPDRIKREITVD